MRTGERICVSQSFYRGNYFFKSKFIKVNAKVPGFFVNFQKLPNIILIYKLFKNVAETIKN